MPQRTARLDVAQLVKAYSRVEQECDAMRSKLAKYELAPKAVRAGRPANMGTSYHQFLDLLKRKFGKSYGSIWALLEANQAARKRGETVPLITENLIHKEWKAKNLVPANVVAYARRVPLDQTEREWTVWSVKEQRYLIKLAKKGGTMDHLAERCSTNFGRKIDRNAVKAKLFRLRQSMPDVLPPARSYCRHS